MATVLAWIARPSAPPSHAVRYASLAMCRNIRLLHNFDPPTTPEEIHDAALQFIRKVSGTRAPSRADKEAFDHAVDVVAAATTELLASLHARGPAHTREAMRAKGKARWIARQARSS